MGGYVPQYFVAAEAILKKLRSGELVAIRLADPEAGRVDDIQVVGQEIVDAYQVKWHQYGGPFTFNDLASDAGGAPSLFSQLTDGWQRIREAQAGHRVIVHLTTNASPSVSDHVPSSSGTNGPTPTHFAAFFHQSWVPATKGLTDPLSNASWRTAWQRLLDVSGLASADFEAFVHGHCVLDLQHVFPGEELAESREEIAYRSDLRQLAQYLMDKVTDRARVIEVGRETLLQELGWANRYGFRFRHEFPVDLDLYEPINQSASALLEAITGLDGGYVALLGSPGAGKSSLLAQTANLPNTSVIKYYAYVPNAMEPVALRGESENFLHDVVLALENRGYRVGPSGPTFERELLMEKFQHQLVALHEEWVEGGHKTVIVIDGLDHIEREQHPARSLLDDLPPPEQVPSGVLFVLGSQTNACFPDRIQAATHEPRRRIEMASLDRTSVTSIARRVLGDLANADICDTLFQATAGHPLALTYLLSRTRGRAHAESIRQVLTESERFEGDITQQYHSYWRSLDQDDDVIRLLALMSRMRPGADIDWLYEHVGYRTIQRLADSAGHFFRKEGARWYFFHNSFRLFVNDRTRGSASSSIADQVDRDLHAQLAVWMGETRPDRPASWDELFHLFSAGQYRAVTERASRERIETQLLALRPIESIEADVKLALQSAGLLSDAYAVARTLILGSELEQCRRNLQDVDFERLLMATGQQEQAMGWVVQGNRLLVSQKTALQACEDLWQTGSTQEASTLFTLAEPSASLGKEGIDPFNRDDDHETLEAWLSCAVHFRTVESIEASISNLRAAPGPLDTDGAESRTRALRNDLRLQFALSLLEAGDAEHFSKVAMSFEGDQDARAYWRVLLSVHGAWSRHEVGDEPGAAGVLRRGLEDAEDSSLDDNVRVILAEACLRVLGEPETAKRLTEGVAPARIGRGTDALHHATAPFSALFSVARLRTALRIPVEPEAMVPDSTDPYDVPLIRLGRAFVELGRAQGRAWAGVPIDPSLMSADLERWVRVVYPRDADGGNRYGLHTTGDVREEYFRLLVITAARHSAQALIGLRDLLVAEWMNPTTGGFWSLTLRRHIALELGRSGIEQSWVSEQLATLESQEPSRIPTSEKLDWLASQAGAWLELGRKEEGSGRVKRMLDTAAGLGFKDDQLEAWIKFAQELSATDREGAPHRLDLLLRCVLALSDTTEDVSASAAEDLILLWGRWNPLQVVSVADHLSRNGFLTFERMLRVLIQAAVDNDDSSAGIAAELLGEVVLPLAASIDGTVVEAVGRALVRLSRGAAAERLQRLIDRALLVAPHSKRAGWVASTIGIANEENIGLELHDLPAASSRDADPEAGWGLRLQNGMQVSVAEILSRVNSPADLAELLEQEDRSAYFGWSSVIAGLMAAATGDEAEQIAELLMERAGRATVLVSLSEKLADLGESRKAWDVAHAALASTEPYQWARWQSGRVASLRALVKIKRVEGSRIALDTLVADCMSGWYPSLMAANLDSIFPLLAPESTPAPLWPEIEAHIQKVFEPIGLSQIEAPTFSESEGDDPWGRALAGLIATYVAHPAQALAGGFCAACLALLQAGNGDMVRAAKEALDEDGAAEESFLMVLEALSIASPAALASFRTEVERAAVSKNYDARLAAGRIAERLEWVLPEEPPRRLLPSIYSLSLAPRGGGLSIPDSPTAISSFRPLPNSTAPSEILRLFRADLSMVAEMAEVELASLEHRVLEIMGQLSPSRGWTEQAEVELRETMNEMHLRLPFRRPRHLLARRAIGRAVAELADAEHFAAEQHQGPLERLLRHYDPLMLLKKPERRMPDVVPAIDCPETRVPEAEAWKQLADDWQRLFADRLRDGWVVIAEDTEIHRSGFPRLAETRKSALVRAIPLQGPLDQNFTGLWMQVHRRVVDEYPGLRTLELPVPIILQHFGHGYESPGEYWLALNPTLAADLGWSPVSLQGLDWVDGEGHPAVKSVWWIDGWVTNDRHDHDEAGEGWLVVASASALNQLSAHLGPVKRRDCIERAYWNDGVQTSSQREALRELSD